MAFGILIMHFSHLCYLAVNDVLLYDYVEIKWIHISQGALANSSFIANGEQ